MPKVILYPSQLHLAWLLLAGIGLFYFTSLYSLFSIAPEDSPTWQNWKQLGEIFKDIVRLYLVNTIKQALLSTLLIMGLAYVLAKALAFVSARLRNQVFVICGASFSLPTILVVFALVNILGNSGWLNQLLADLGLSYRVKLYGLTGILIANLFFNLGYVTNIFYHSLSKVPLEFKMQSKLYNFSYWQNFKHLDYPALKFNLLNVGLLIFMMCFNSFALVLFLGGPQYINLEVEIYHSLVNELNFTKAALIAVVQISISAVFIFAISQSKKLQTQVQSASSTSETSLVKANYLTQLTKQYKLKLGLSYSLGVLAIVFILLPLFSIIISGCLSLYAFIAPWWQEANQTVTDIYQYSWQELVTATSYSFIIAGFATLTSLGISIGLLRGFRWFASKQQNLWQNFSLISLAIPNMILGAGFFLLFNLGLDIQVGTEILLLFMIFATAVSNLAFSINYLVPTFNQIDTYLPRIKLLNLSSWQSFWLIEFPLLKKSLLAASVNIFILALGDFSLILFFVNDNLTSITYLLSQQLGGFHSDQGNVTALTLLSLILILRYFVQSRIRV